MSPALHFASFGSRPHYLRLSRQTLTELGRIYPDAQLWALTLRDLGPEAEVLKDYARQYPRGYGYWRWKPVVVDYMSHQVNDDDVVIYVDGRCGIPQCPIPWVDEFVEDKSLDFVAWQMDGMCEQRWTTGDMLAHFGHELDSQAAVSDQFAGGILGFRKNQTSALVIEEWRTLVECHPELCRDDPSTLPNAPEFCENRYDQSAISLTLKKHSEAELRLRVLRAKDFEGPCAILPQVKGHPRRIRGTEPFFRWVRSLREYSSKSPGD